VVAPVECPLVLGGHTFIQQLGNEPKPTEDEQVRIVETCLNQGIRWFDTTYRPERVALGQALSRLGRRNEAVILAWNFFTSFGDEDDVGAPDYYQPHHLDQMLDELQTDHIDGLVVHQLDDPERNSRQEELAQGWQRRGVIRWLGTWYPPVNPVETYGLNNPYSFMVRPYNVTTPEAAPAFSACKALGWQTLACSPFVRGWELDKRLGRSNAPDRAQLADRMLRYALFRPHVDRLIVAMRREAWVVANIASWRCGPLTEVEMIE